MKISIKLICITCFVSTVTSVAASCTKNNPERQDPPATQTPIAKADVTAKGVLTVSIENKLGAGSAEGSPKLIDGDINTKFLIFDFKPGFYMQLSFDTARLIGAYKLTSANDADGRDPMNWTITASNDGSNWVTLDQQMGELFRKRQQTKEYNFKNKTAYKYYRWNISSNYHDQQLFQIAEWRLIQVPEKEQSLSPVSYIDSTKKEGLSLYFFNKSSEASLPYQQKLINVFFTNYPKLLKDFNPNATKTVSLIMDPTYDGVAYAIGQVIVFSTDYMKKYPNDIDIITHEGMHLVQAYSGGAPGWLTEGIADYVRYKYGYDNTGAGWSLPPYNSSQSYTNAYRVTARFLAWIELHVKPGFVKLTDAAIRNKTYTDAFWKAQTGKTVDELWAQYGANPTL